ncbi:MAG TPA: DUF6531 domain-containing protein, partial [Solirubrobacteraceae bacterium]
MLFFVRLLTIVVCGVVALSGVGAGTASAWAPVSKAEEEELAKDGLHIERRTEPFKSGNVLGWCEGLGLVCHSEPEITLPAGEYVWVDTLGGIPVAYNHNCNKRVEPPGEETCEGSPIVVPGFPNLVTYKMHNGEGDWHAGDLYVFMNEIGWEYRPIEGEKEREAEQFGERNKGEPNHKACLLGYPVDCATGNQTVTQTDLAVGGSGPALALTRTYNSRLAAKQTEHGPFGFGWTGSYSAHLEVTSEGAEATVYQDNGSTVTFTRSGIVQQTGEGQTFEPNGPWTAPSSLAEATLADEGSGYIYTLPNQTILHFNSAGQLTSETDRDGNALTMSYESGHLVSVTDAAGRKLTFAYNAEGEVESAKDPMGHTVKYTYESGNLKSVTQPAETALRWQFEYNSEHELTSETDGRKNTVTTEYNGSHQVVSQTDPLSRKREWKYGGSRSEPETKITEPNGSETVEHFNEGGEPTNITHAHGVSGLEATTEYEYNGSGELVKLTDP